MRAATRVPNCGWVKQSTALFAFVCGSPGRLETSSGTTDTVTVTAGLTGASEPTPIRSIYTYPVTVTGRRQTHAADTTDQNVQRSADTADTVNTTDTADTANSVHTAVLYRFDPRAVPDADLAFGCIRIGIWRAAYIGDALCLLLFSVRSLFILTNSSKTPVLSKTCGKNLFLSPRLNDLN